jgi:hypothetical protein
MKQKFYLLMIILATTAPARCYGKIDSIKHAKDSVITKSHLEKVGELKPEWYDHKAWPWVASLLIGVITVGINFYISMAARKTSLAVVQKQIESSVNLAKVQFQFSLNSKNRQDWINELRNCISEFATHARQLNIYLQSERDDKEKAFVLQEKVYLYKSKIRLLLTPSIEKHGIYLTAQEDLMNVLEIHLLNSKAKIDQFNNQDFIVKSDFMIEKGRELLYFEWQKVQLAQANSIENSNSFN